MAPGLISCRQIPVIGVWYGMYWSKSFFLVISSFSCLVAISMFGFFASPFLSLISSHQNLLLCRRCLFHGSQEAMGIRASGTCRGVCECLSIVKEVGEGKCRPDPLINFFPPSSCSYGVRVCFFTIPSPFLLC